MNEAQRKTKELMPFILKEINQYIKPNTTTSTATSATTGGASASALAALQAAFNAHQGLDFVAAHVTNDPTINVHKEFYSDDFGVLGDGTTDDSNAIARMLETVGAAGGGVCIVNSQTPTGSIYINKVINLAYSNVHLRFRSPIIRGGNSSIRIMGELGQDTTLGKAAAKLTTNAAENGYTLTLSTSAGVMQSSDFAVGDKIVIRGLNDVNGKAIQKQETFISAINNTTHVITVVDELDYTFQPWYGPSPTVSSPITSSDWAADATTGTTIYKLKYSAFTGNVSAGATSATVASVAYFAVGDLLIVNDNRTEYDMNNSALKGSGSPPTNHYLNPGNVEMVKIIRITGTTVYFDRALERSYLTANYGGISLVLPVKNSSISGVDITWNADDTSTSYTTLQQTYAENCEIYNCRINGLGGRMGQAIRTSYAWRCGVHDNYVDGCKFSASGQGYGITWYYCTHVDAYNNFVSGCRHNYLFQGATLCMLYDSHSHNHLISGIDFHGAQELACKVDNCLCTQADEFTSDSDFAAAIRVGNTSHSGGSHRIRISNCEIYYANGVSNAAIDAGFDFIPASSEVEFVNIWVYNAGYGCRLTLNSSQVTPIQVATNITIRECHFINCTTQPFRFTAAVTGGASAGKISGLFLLNNIDDGNSLHYEINGVGSGGISNVYMCGNTIVNNVSTATKYGANVSTVAGLTMANNIFNGANRGIKLTSCTGPGYIGGNHLYGLVDGVANAYLDNGGNTFLLGANFTDTGVGIGTGNPGHLLDVQDLSGANVAFIQTLNALTAVNSHAALALVNQSTAVNTIVGLDFLHYNASGTNKVIATQEAAPSTVTAGAEVGFLRWALINAGTVAEVARLTPTGLGIGVTAPARRLDVSDLSGANSAIIRGSASGTAVNSQAVLSLENQNNSNNTITALALMHWNSSSTSKTAATIEATLSDNTNAAEYGFLRFCSMYNGTVTERLRITDNGFVAVSGVLTVGTNALISGYIYGPGGTNTLSTYQDLSVGGGSGSGNLTVNGNVTVTGNWGAWTNVTFAGSWANKSGSDVQCQYRKTGDRVQLRGEIKWTGGSPPTLASTVCTLPYAPVNKEWFPIRANNFAGHVSITTGGFVSVESLDAGNANSYLMLGLIEFSTI